MNKKDEWIPLYSEEEYEKAKREKQSIDQVIELLIKRLALPLEKDERLITLQLIGRDKPKGTSS